MITIMVFFVLQYSPDLAVMTEQCRLCRGDLLSRSQPKTNFRDLIKRAFKVDVDSECKCHSQRVCERCRKDLQKYRKHYQHNRKPYKFSIDNVNVDQHRSSCTRIQVRTIQKSCIVIVPQSHFFFKLVVFIKGQFWRKEILQK